MHFAAKYGDISMINALTEFCAEISCSDHAGNTPFHIAAQYGKAEAINVLLEAGADISAQTGDGWTSMHIAAQNGHPEVVLAFKIAGVDPSIQTGQTQKTPLHRAVLLGHTDVVNILIKVGAVVSLRDSEGETALTLTNYQHDLDPQIIKALEKADTEQSTKKKFLVIYP